ncbi:MAG: XrtA/PEP-CTERM system TPR-repeat protein PrsT [Rubrivivax sp.]
MPNRRPPLVPLTCVAALTLLLAACEGPSTEQQLTDARAALARKDTASATIKLKNILADTPNADEARLLLGQTLLQGGDLQAALVELRKVAGRLPDDKVLPDLARAMLAAGEGAALLGQFGSTALRDPAAMADLKSSVAAAYAATGNLQAAREAATEALRAGPGQASAMVLLAALDAQAGDAVAAMARVDEVLARDKGHERAGLLKADLLQRQGKPDDALAVLKDVVGAHPDAMGPRVAAIELLLAQRQVPEAKALLGPLVQQAPKHPLTVFTQARVAFDEGDHATCRSLLDGLVTGDRVDPRVLMLAGLNDFALGRLGPAEAHLGRVLKTNPQSLPARQLLARVHLRMAQPERSLEALRPVVERPNADAQSLGLYGQALLAIGEAAQAQQAFERAARADPGAARMRTGVALAQFARGDTAAALSQLETLARGEGSEANADLALIALRLRQNDIPGALRAVQGWLKKSPDDPDALALQGRLQARSGNEAAAVASFERVLAKAPTHLPAVTGLVELDLRADRRDAARKRLEALLQADPRNARAQLAMAELEARLGAPDAVVLKRLRDAIAVDSQLLLARQLLVDRLLASGDTAGALTAAQEAQAARSDDLGALAVLGVAQLAAKEGQNAIVTFRKLTSAQPRQPMHHLRLADAYLLVKDGEAARESIRQALKINAQFLPALRAQGLMAVMDKRPDEAVAVARSVQKRLPNDPAGYVLEAELESAAQRWTGAAAAYGQALQKAPSSTIAIRQHQVLLKAGKAADAERLAADWLKRHADDTTFLYHLGDVASAAQDWVSAEARYRAVLKLQPRHAGAVNNVAWLMAKQGKPGAVAMAEQAAELLPERAPVLDTLALALEAEQQLPRAVKVQRRATELAPKDADLRLRLAQLLIRNGDKADARTELEALSRLGAQYARQGEVAALLKTL